LETAVPEAQAGVPTELSVSGGLRKSDRRGAHVRRLATYFTAAAFHNRRLGGLLEPSTEDQDQDRDLSLWADAWDRVAALVRSVDDDRTLRRLAAELEREAALATTGEWRAVCTHAAEEIARLDPARPRD
jgi:hypothetical protein